VIEVKMRLATDRFKVRKWVGLHAPYRWIALGLWSAILSSGAVLAQTAEPSYNWIFTKGVAANGSGSTLDIRVPQGNGLLGRFACVDNQGKGTYTVLTLAAHIGQLRSGTPAQVTLTTPQGRYDFNGLVVEPATGGGIKGITFSLANNHPVWPSLAHGSYVDYQVKGYTGSRLSLASSGGKIALFAQACSGQSPAPALVTAPRPPVPATPPAGQTASGTPGSGQANAQPQQPALPFYQTKPGRSAWRNRNYPFRNRNGTQTVYTARVTNGGLALHAFCSPQRNLYLFITRSGNGYPDFEQRIRQATAKNPSFEFAFAGGPAFRLPMGISPATGPKGELIVEQTSDSNSDFISQLLSASSVSVRNPPFGASFQLRGSKKAICATLRQCGASSGICGDKSPAASGNASGRCRSRSVYVPGRGCILKKFAR